jgi:hypothetical protein
MQIRELAAVNAETITSFSGDSPGGDAAELVARIARHAVPRWHFAMLNDDERSTAFAAALARHIRPGMHVIDIGSGSGLLAMMALRAGAGKVTTCEANPLLAEIARRVIAANGMSGDITVIPKISTELQVGRDLADRADLIVSEIVDCGLVGEGLLATMRHARRELLAPGGAIIPAIYRLHGALVESASIDGLNRVGSAAGFDVSPFNVAATSGYFTVRAQTWPLRALSAEVKLVEFDVAAGSLDDGECTVQVPVTSDGIVHGLLAWFEMDLGGFVLRSSPGGPESHWMQAYAPFPEPFPVAITESVEVILRWQGTQFHVFKNNGLARNNTQYPKVNR